MIYLSDDKHLYQSRIIADDDNATSALNEIDKYFKNEYLLSREILSEAIKEYETMSFGVNENPEGYNLKNLILTEIGFNPYKLKLLKQTNREKYDKECKKLFVDYYVFEKFVAPFINLDTIVKTYNIDDISEYSEEIIKIGDGQIDKVISLSDKIEVGRGNVDVLKRVNRVPKYINKK